jgi:WD repeat-containing protein 45
MLACTSDKGSLHVFDVSSTRRPATSAQATHSPISTPGSTSNAPSDPKNKWGLLQHIPFGPFTDVYSFASTRFEAGEDALTVSSPAGESSVLGTTRPMKGVIGWISEGNLVVAGAGTDPRWERFILGENAEGRFIVREGWKRYLAGK